MSTIFLYNARIWTGRRGQAFSESILIKGNTVAAIGRTKDLRNIISGDIIEIDLKGRTVLPGFTDAHMHITEWAKREKQIGLDGFDSLDELIQHVKRAIPDTEWVLGGGWNHNLWEEKRLPNMDDLSFISPLQKVIFFSKDYHSAWVNEPVIDLIDPKMLAKYIDNKQIETNSIGQLTGIFKEDAMIHCVVPLVDAQPSPLTDFSTELFDKFHYYGITSLHSFETFSNYRTLRELYQNSIHRGPRLSIYVYHHDRQKVEEYLMKSGDGGPWLRFMGLKYFLDGSLGSQTAWLKTAYENNSEYFGVNLWEPEKIRKAIGGTEDGHLKLAVHAIGDGALAEALDLLQGRVIYEGIPDRIEHAQLVDDELLTALEGRDVGICANPSHLLTDYPTAEKYWGSRGRYAFALKSMREKGLPVAFGSDAPVESINPWMNIAAAVYRTPKYSGIPWYPEETLSLEEALEMACVNAAKLSGESEQKGMLLPGYFADLTVCSKDPFNCDMNEMLNIRSLLTVIDGKVVTNELEEREN